MFVFRVNIFISLLFCITGLVVLIIAIVKDHRAQGITINDYREKLNLSFSCPECKARIREPINYEKVSGVPILFECKSCQVLWYTGNFIENDA
jgi:hypothetical protein